MSLLGPSTPLVSLLGSLYSTGEFVGSLYSTFGPVLKTACPKCFFSSYPPGHPTKYSEYSLIRCNLLSKNMVDLRVWWINWIIIGTCTLYWYWEIVIRLKGLVDKPVAD